jgi:hypothetical protein
MRLSAGTSDTVTINTRRPLWLNVNVVNFAGRSLPQSALRFAFAGGDSVSLTTDGQVICGRRSDSNVSVVGGSVSALLTVLCRPIIGVAFTPGLRLFAGGASSPLPLVAIGPDHQVVLLRSPRTQLGNDSIASINGLLIGPRMPGLTWVDVTVGDCIQTIEIAVDDSVAMIDSLVRPYTAYVASLSGASGTQWRLGPGRYELWLRTSVANTYSIDVGNAPCARVRSSGQRMECILTDHETIAVRQLAHGPVSSASMSIRHLPDSSVARAAAIGRIARRLQSHTIDCEEFDFE